MLFIDGDYSYEDVNADFKIYSHLVKEEGLISFHDIVPDKEPNEGNWVGELHRFWQEIKGNYDYKEFIEDHE